jgi:hypothetical protein
LVPSGIVHDAQAKSRRIEKNLKINDGIEYSRKMVENPGDLRVRIRPIVQLESGIPRRTNQESRAGNQATRFLTPDPSTMRFIMKKGSVTATAP